jgi:hypothetical protein
MKRLVLVQNDGRTRVIARAPALAREAADLCLAREPEGSWVRARLETCARPALGYTLEATRTPTWAWVDASEWPESATRAELPSYDATLCKLEAWVGSMGIHPTWDEVIRTPWPGHQNGPLTEGGCLDPDAHLLECARRAERSPLHAMLELVFREGMERGAYIERMQRAEIFAPPTRPKRRYTRTSTAR